MKRISPVLALAGACTLGLGGGSDAGLALETYEAKMEATDAASQARMDMHGSIWTKGSCDRVNIFGETCRSRPEANEWLSASRTRLAYLYRGNMLMAVATVSSGEPGRDTPTGIFAVRGKKTMHRSKKYDNAPMPFAQFIDEYGIAMHAGYNPGTPASHGCVRLPSAFAKKLYSVTDVGTPVYIGA